MCRWQLCARHSASMPDTLWSRRIDDEHRLVHLVTDKVTVILAARHHY
nr:type II toxin-antitoxin system YoeB family toxin [Streptomyces atratus]